MSSAPSASYISPSDTHTFTIPQQPTTTNPSTKTQAQTAHLSALRASTKQLQSDINAFLTQKMEEDKAAAASNANDKKSGKSRDEEEEENYGEETVEDD